MPTSIHHCLCAIRHLETKFSQIFLGNIFASYVTNCYSNCHFVLYSRRKKSPYSELFWSAFSPDFPAFGLNTERQFSISPYSVRMQENPGKMRTRILIIYKIGLETQKIKKQLGKQSNLQMIVITSLVKVKVIQMLLTE